jgi:hypothetical protein
MRTCGNACHSLRKIRSRRCRFLPVGNPRIRNQDNGARKLVLQYPVDFAPCLQEAWGIGNLNNIDRMRETYDSKIKERIKEKEENA